MCDERQKQHNGLIVVAVLFLVAVTIGVLAYWRFVVSDRYLQQDAATLHQRGGTLTLEGCVDAVMAWTGRCRAMKSLCDATTPRMIHACLKGADRRQACKALGDRSQDTRLGFKECQDRGVDRRSKKLCAMAYRAIATHCRSLAGENVH